MSSLDLQATLWLQSLKGSGPALDLFLEQWLVLASEIGNPSSVLATLVPMLFALRPRLAPTVMVAYISADILNGMLKFPLMGDRPYWLSEEVRQYPHTCESGYGMPSGHVMTTTTAWLTLLLLLQQRGERAPARAVALFCAVLLPSVMLSRVYT